MLYTSSCYYYRLFIYTLLSHKTYAILENRRGGLYMCNNEENGNRCMAEILEVILLLQKNADCGDSCLDTCDRGFLGCSTTCCVCNTRPVTFYLCGSNSDPLRIPISKDFDEDVTSSVFRVEKLDGNCCTCRVLARNLDDNDNGGCSHPFVATNSFFTLNLNCLCCIRCLQDTCVDCI
jgi:hypothetical protein